MPHIGYGPGGGAGAREKIRRANKHIEALHETFREFLTDSPYRFVIKTDTVVVSQAEVPVIDAARLRLQVYGDLTASKPDHVVAAMRLSEDVGIYVVRLKPVPITKMGALIGDVVHNLRSALDQVVFELAVHYQRSLASPLAPIPRPGRTLPHHSPYRFATFPVINSQEQKFWEGAKTSKLRLVDQNLIPKFANEQPFQRGKQYQRHWLWLLHELWNRDKHRTITLTTDYAVIQGIRLRAAPGGPSAEELDDLFEWQPIWTQSVGRFVDGMKLAQFRVRRKRPGFPEPEAVFNVDTALGLGVAFNKAPPTYAEGIFDCLKGLSANVERVLDSFQGDFK